MCQDSAPCAAAVHHTACAILAGLANSTERVLGNAFNTGCCHLTATTRHLRLPCRCHAASQCLLAVAERENPTGQGLCLPRCFDLGCVHLHMRPARCHLRRAHAVCRCVQCLLAVAKRESPTETENLIRLNARLVALCANHDSIEADPAALEKAAEVYRDLLGSVRV